MKSSARTREQADGSSAAIARDSVYRVHDLIIDPIEQRVVRGGKEVPLSRLSFRLLLTLVRAAPGLVTFEQLMQSVWPGLVISPETVSQRVKLVRDALADDAHSPQFIVGIRGRGYRLIAPVDVLPSAGEPSQAAADRPALATWLAALRWPGPVFVAALLAASVLLPFQLESTRTRSGGTAIPSVRVTAPRTVAVLPFANFGDDAADERLGDGLTAELTQRLASLPGVLVVARTSAAQFKNRPASAQHVGRALYARYLLEGSVRREGPRVRITAQLVSAANGYHLWSGTYDRVESDALALQDEVSLAVVRAVRRQLLPRTASEPYGPRARVPDSEMLRRAVELRALDPGARPPLPSTRPRDSA